MFLIFFFLSFFLSTFFLFNFFMIFLTFFHCFISIFKTIKETDGRDFLFFLSFSLSPFFLSLYFIIFTIFTSSFIIFFRCVIIYSFLPSFPSFTAPFILSLFFSFRFIVYFSVFIINFQLTSFLQSFTLTLFLSLSILIFRPFLSSPISIHSIPPFLPTLNDFVAFYFPFSLISPLFPLVSRPVVCIIPFISSRRRDSTGLAFENV